MVIRLLDKILFTAFLLTGLQVPQLIEQYQQYLAGYFDATHIQVEGFKANAILNGYSDVFAMIDDHLKNQSNSVRTDAEQKMQTLSEYEELVSGMSLFQTGSTLEKSVYIFNPKRLDFLKGTMKNFEPGIPLSIGAFVYALILAVFMNAFVASPVYAYKWRKRRKSNLRKPDKVKVSKTKVSKTQ